MRESLRRLLRRLHPPRPPAPAVEGAVELRAYDLADFDSPEGRAADGFGVTPREYRHSAAPTFEAWMEAGREHFASMLRTLGEAGFRPAPGCRVLDFGASAGRTARQWMDGVEVWGCEISFERTMWCKRNIGLPHRFVQSAERPPLPFEDRSFDLVYAGSVFTHISHGIDTWLVELRRILRAGGLLYLTIHDETSWRLLRERRSAIIAPALARFGDRAELPHDFLAIGRDAESQVFCRSRAFRELAEPYYAVEAFVPEARGYQSAFLLRRPRDR